jgi:hypothetical protein
MLFGDKGKHNFDLTGYDYAFTELFDNCADIIEVSKNFLPATTLSYSCYNGMFKNCTSLTNTPLLPASTLTSYCYANMFSGCTSLTDANAFALSKSTNKTATNSWCCGYMFARCTSLKTGYTPYCNGDTTLMTRMHCFNSMFTGCTKLNQIYALFPHDIYSGSFNKWVTDVAQSGEILVLNVQQWTSAGVYGENGIPSTDWNVAQYTEFDHGGGLS